nr:hypothetical protein [Tanacetum cinerariifolium]
MSNVSKKIKRVWKYEMHALFKQSLKPVHREFNSLNRLEAERSSRMYIFRKNMIIRNHDQACELITQLVKSNQPSSTTLSAAVERENITKIDMTKEENATPCQPKHSSTMHPTMSGIPSLSKSNKGKIKLIPLDSYLRLIMAFMEQGGSKPNLSDFKNFRASNEPSMTIEEATQLMEEEKRQANIKKANEE